MAGYKCKFPFIDHPSCTSIMQQENNEIADEVKEVYSKISTDISKPIICCPEKKASYCYNPKSPSTVSSASDCGSEKINYTERKQTIDKVIQSINRTLSDNENVDTTSVHEIAAEALQKIANSPYEKRHIQCNEFNYDAHTYGYTDSLEVRTKLNDSLDDGENGDNNDGDNQVDNRVNDDVNQRTLPHSCVIPSPTRSPQMIKSSKNLFTESEVHNAIDMKSLFFEKWMKHAGDLDEASEESINLKDASISYDDMDSVLTSISRMDSNRMKKLRNTRFYRKMVNGMQSIKSESVLNDDELYDENENEDKENIKRNLKRIVTTPNHLHMTQEELNHIAVNTDRAYFDSVDARKQKRYMRDYTIEERKRDAALRAKIKALADLSDEEERLNGHIRKELDGKSEDLFRVVRQSFSPKKDSPLTKVVSSEKHCSSCSDSENTLEELHEEREAKDPGNNNKEPLSVKNNAKIYTSPPANIGKIYRSPPEKQLKIIKQSTKLTNWSKTRPTTNTQKSIYDTDFTSRDNKCESYTSPKHSLSSCSCSSKTTTWEEIALKEKLRLKGEDYTLSEDLERLDVVTKEFSKSDVLYIISNNNCFMLPIIDEKNVHSDSDITRTSYYLDGHRKESLDDSNTRNTT